MKPFAATYFAVILPWFYVLRCTNGWKGRAIIFGWRVKITEPNRAVFEATIDDTISGTSADKHNKNMIRKVIKGFKITTIPTVKYPHVIDSLIRWEYNDSSGDNKNSGNIPGPSGTKQENENK